MFELSADHGRGIYALPWLGRRWGKAIRLPAGAIVEPVPAERQHESPRRYVANMQIDALGLVWPDTGPRAEGNDAPFFGGDGPYLLPSGEIAIVYGAKAIPIGVPAC